MTLVSVVITSHDHERYVGAAIESALVQTHESVEVVVVDDGSTDATRSVIASFGDAVRAVEKEQGGQTSAMNAGYAVARGEVVVFLDGDDTLAPEAARRAVERSGAGIAKVHWPLREIDAAGTFTGQLRPGAPLDHGDLRSLIVAEGPDSYLSAPHSGNAWSRAFLEQVLPLPELERETGRGSASADDLLCALAALHGRVERVDEPLGTYRVHGANDYAGRPFDERLRHDVELYERRVELVARECARLGLDADVAAWRARSWYGRLRRAVDAIAAAVPAGRPFVLLDEGQWGMEATDGRRAEVLWGAPAQPRETVEVVERALADAGAEHVVVGWPAFWWLDFAPQLRAHLDERFERLPANGDLMIYARR